MPEDALQQCKLHCPRLPSGNTTQADNTLTNRNKSSKVTHPGLEGWL